MNKADRISGIFWLLFGMIVSIESWRMGLGSLHQPGPGYIFFWVGILLAILSLIILVPTWRTLKEGRERNPTLGRVNLFKIILVLISLVFYGLLMEKLGFIVVTLLLFIFLLGIVEKRGWGLTLLTSLIVTAAAYLLFETALHSQLPKGLLGFWRF